MAVVPMEEMRGQVPPKSVAELLFFFTNFIGGVVDGFPGRRVARGSPRLKLT
jgi:hypothetical protein